MKFHIKSKYFPIYIVLCFFILSFFVYIYLYDQSTDTRNALSPYAMEKWEAYDLTPTLTRSIVEGTIENPPAFGNMLAFYSIHQNIMVYVDEELIYQYPVINNNPLSSSPGYCWNFIQLPHTVNQIKIEISSPYDSYLKNIPTFYVGNDVSITSYIFLSNLMVFLICVIMFCAGLYMVVYHYAVSRNIQTNNKLFYLGLFAIVLSIWSVNESPLLVLLEKNSLVSSYASFLALMMLPIPFALFVKNFYEDDRNTWDIFCWVDIVQVIGCILLQVTDIADLRVTLWSTHFMLVALAVIVLHSSYRLFQNGTRSKQIITHLVCIIICAVTLILDIAGYYTGTWDSNSFGRFGFLFYIVVLGISSTRESASLMRMGRKASDYQQLAYTDQMTGMNNRTCFNADFEKLSKTPDDIAVVDFDLNDLKRTNDTYGHSIGDRYIQNCSDIIREIFDGIGKCYRVGGDEFVAIIENSSTVDLIHYMAMLESSVDVCNRNDFYKSRNLRMQIAYGYAVYSPELDKSLEDTYNRADKIMYEDKKRKKEIRAK